MSQLSKSSFDTSYANASGNFLTNGIRAITAAIMRAFSTDIKDSVLFITDNFVDEDDMSSNSDTKVPSQQSVKAYVDNSVSSGVLSNTDTQYFIQDDFAFGSSLFTNTASGTAAGSTYSTVGQDATEKAFGVLEQHTGTDTNGRDSIRGNTLNAVGFIFGYGHTCRIRFRSLLEALSDGTDTYTVYMGFMDNAGSGDMVDGCYFRYTHSVNSGKWEAVNSSNSSRTAVDTGVTAQITTFSVFTITVNSDATSASFDIDGTTVANTSSIPTGAGRETTFGIKIEKSAGTTSRLIYTDWFDLLVTRTTAR